MFVPTMVPKAAFLLLFTFTTITTTTSSLVFINVWSLSLPFAMIFANGFYLVSASSAAYSASVSSPSSSSSAFISLPNSNGEGGGGLLTEEIQMLTDSNVNTDGNDVNLRTAECHLRPVVHILQHAGCIPKPIPSFACYGTCTSYVRVSSSKFWQVERSCNCCQDIGEREAVVSLFCPKQNPKFRKVTTKAPVECLCRPCTAVDEKSIQPQELLDHHGPSSHHRSNF